MALLRAGLLVVLFVVAVAAREGCEAEDEALLQVTQVDTMAGSQVTPKTWTSPRDLAYVPPPQTGKLSRFLNISIYSAAPDIAVKRREGPGKLHLLSHRSCSQDQSAECNQGFIKEMEGVSKEADTWPEINERHLYTSLPDELMNDPRWQNHVKPGVRGRGYWFWKAALSRMLLSQGVFQLGDELLYVDGDSKTMIKHIIRMRSRNPGPDHRSHIPLRPRLDKGRHLSALRDYMGQPALWPYSASTRKRLSDAVERANLEIAADMGGFDDRLPPRFRRTFQEQVSPSQARATSLTTAQNISICLAPKMRPLVGRCILSWECPA